MKNNGKRTWTKEEFEKTLVLFFDLVREKNGFSKDNEKIIEVANDLGRSVNSVIMRLQNYVFCLRQICPEKADEYGLGNGLSNGGKECMYLLENFLSSRGVDVNKEKEKQSPAINPFIVNRIILKLAVKMGDEEYNSDGSVSNSLDVLLRYADNDLFSLSQLEDINKAVRVIIKSAKSKGDIADEVFYEIIGSVIDEKTANSLKKLISLFIVRFE